MAVVRDVMGASVRHTPTAIALSYALFAAQPGFELRGLFAKHHGVHDADAFLGRAGLRHRRRVSLSSYLGGSDEASVCRWLRKSETSERVFLVPFGSIPATGSFDPCRLAGADRFDVLCRCIIASLLCSRRLRRDTSFIAALAKPSWTTRVGRALSQSLSGTLPTEAGDTRILEVEGCRLLELSPDEHKVALKLAQVLTAFTQHRALAEGSMKGYSEGEQTCQEGPRQAQKLGNSGPGDGVSGWKLWNVASLRELVSSVHRPPGANLLGKRNSLLLVLTEDAKVPARDALAEAYDAGIDRIIFVLGDHIGLRPAASDLLATDFGALRVHLGQTPLLTSQCISVLQFLADEYWPACTSRTNGVMDEHR